MLIIMLNGKDSSFVHKLNIVSTLPPCLSAYHNHPPKRNGMLIEIQQYIHIYIFGKQYRKRKRKKYRNNKTESWKINIKHKMMKRNWYSFVNSKVENFCSVVEWKFWINFRQFRFETAAPKKHRNTKDVPTETFVDSPVNEWIISECTSELCPSLGEKGKWK